jgi:hypothetical protein
LDIWDKQHNNKNPRGYSIMDNIEQKMNQAKLKREWNEKEARRLEIIRKDREMTKEISNTLKKSCLIIW